MLNLDLSRQKGLIISILLAFFVHQSTSKTKRSRKLPVQIHKSSFEEDDLFSLDFDVINGGCSRGCEACDPVNDCTKCRPRNFLHISRDLTRGRESGKCTHRCPPGYFGQRSIDGNLCKKCSQSNCSSCFSAAYCMSCEDGFYLHDAACVLECPSGLGPDKKSKKCVEKVDCEVGVWASWSSCALRSQKKSCKYGRKKRTRIIVREPTENGKRCPKLKETKKCKTPANRCPMVNKIFIRQMRRRVRKSRKTRKGRKKKKGKRHKIRSNDTMAARSRRDRET